MLITGCEEKVVEKFDDNASLYFYRDMYTANNQGVLQYDSIDYSFFLAGSAQETEIWLQVELTGKCPTKHALLRLCKPMPVIRELP